MSTKNIMIVGVGGQGTLLASKMLGYVLLNQGYDVKVCHDGREGFDEAQSGAYDLILLDLMLPGLNGIEICSRW